MSMNKEWITIPITADGVKLLSCMCGRCWTNRDTECICGLKYAPSLHMCPACGRPSWCKT